MFYHRIWAIIAIALLLGTAPSATAMSSLNKNQFRRIEQPLPVKVGVGMGGLALVGLELWWFLSKSSHTG